MRPLALVLAFVLLSFAAFTARVVADYGYLGFFGALLGNSVGIQAFLDLTIALALVLSWMRIDARSRSLPFVPYLLVTLGLGSIGPLAYLLHRAVRPSGPAA